MEWVLEVDANVDVGWGWGVQSSSADGVVWCGWGVECADGRVVRVARPRDGGHGSGVRQCSVRAFVRSFVFWYTCVVVR